MSGVTWRWPEPGTSHVTMSAPMQLTFVIPGVPPSLNALLRMHWKARRRLGLMWSKLIWAARTEQLASPFGPMKKAAVTIERRSPRLLDTDNAYGAVKMVVDGLKSNGIITDDSPEYITLTVMQTKGPAQTTIHVKREQ